MTRITRFRFTIRQRSQIRFTEGLTFIGYLGPNPKGNPPTRQIIGREFHRHLIPWQNSYEMHPHLSCHMGQNLMAVLQFHPKHRIGKRLEDLPLYLDVFFFGHWVKISGVSSVTATVCSK